MAKETYITKIFRRVVNDEEKISELKKTLKDFETRIYGLYFLIFIEAINDLDARLSKIESVVKP